MGRNDNQNQDNNTETGNHRDMILVINWRE